MASDVLKDLTEAYSYDTDNWQAIRKEAKIDMQFVAGDPWTADDKKQRKDRPTVAPEELSQYRNQVENALMANPRGMKFSPVGNGANDKGAEFYQNKAREIEYRSHASQQYLLAADNALQRSYGFVRVNVKYANPRSVNQDIYIEGFPNPDMVMPDSDSLRPDSADMRRCFVTLWMPQTNFKRDYPNAKIHNFTDFATTNADWIKGNKVQVAEYWQIQTTTKKLLLATAPGPQAPPRQTVPVQTQPIEVQLFEEEIQAAQQRIPGLQVVRELRSVEYPQVWMYLTNGLEILHEQEWLGKYIPIVSCYGKVLYVEGEIGMERKILSMTRFGRDPWKSYCYCCSQQLEIIGQVPRTSVVAAKGQLKGVEKDWAESPHVPKAFLLYNATDPDNPGVQFPPPQRVPYLQGENLQALEMVKEGFRRAIQAAMGSNFMPTQAQRRNEKSGVALDKIEQAAARGTYHFVNSYEDMIRQVGVITEDLMDKIYDFRGETGVIDAGGKAITTRINDPDAKDAISTKGDYLVTVSTAPSSDSEREAAADFTETLVGNLQMVAQVASPKAAAAVLARAIRMRNLGPQGDQLADIIEPPEYKSKDGEPPSPEVLAMQQQLEHAMQLLKQAAEEKNAKVVETQGKFSIAQMQEDAETQRSAKDREVDLAVAAMKAQHDQTALFMEESRLVGARQADAIEAMNQRLHELLENQKDRQHERHMASLSHQQALEQGQQGHQQALEQGDQATAGQLEIQANKPETGATA